MATYVLIHGASSDSWYWHRVLPLLQAAGHDVVAPDLPVGDPAAGLPEYTETVLSAIGDRRDLIVVAQSMGGFTGPLVADRVPVGLIVLVAAMVPAPGESLGAWWDNTGFAEAKQAADAAAGRAPGFDPEVLFFHDVPAEVTAEAFRRGEVQQSDGAFGLPWPLEKWPDVPTRFLLCKQDRFFPADFQRRVVKERLGFEPDEMDSGHLPALAHPEELVARLEAYRKELGLS